jgi:polynucleotide 5'-hydroxyl-kinase GRC3/NOL9
MDIEQYPEWQIAIERLTQEGGTVLLLGGTDAGKTTFCALLANSALTAGRSVAVVDGDIGQSEIGPPGCVGAGLPQTALRSLAEIEPKALGFVGATSPRGHLLEHATAVASIVGRALSYNPDLLVIDTTGFIRGTPAMRLKWAKIELVAPGHIIALQRKDECEPLLAPFKHSSHPRIERLPIPGVIATKSPVYRAQRRAARFARYFDGAVLYRYRMDEVALAGTWLGSGRPVEPHFARFISNALKLRAYYAEETGSHLGIVTSGLPARDADIATVHEQFRTRAITITPAAKLQHLLVGLSDGDGKVLGVGLIESIHFGGREIGIVSPLRAPGAVKLIQFGIVRVKPDGTEVGTNRPGEV